MRLVAPAILAIMTLVSVACSSAPAASSLPTAVPASSQATSPTTTAAAAATSTFPLTIKDDAGRDVTIPKPPQRIISLSSSNTEILFALGLENRVVGVDQYSNYPPSAKSKPTVGDFANPDLEKIVALEPNLILADPYLVRGAGRARLGAIIAIAAPLPPGRRVAAPTFDHGQ